MYNYPPGYSFFGTYKRALEAVRSPLETIQDSVRIYGDTYSVVAGLKSRMMLTQNPEFIDYILRKNQKNYYKSKWVTEKLARFIGNGLLTSNGAYWLRQRRLIQPGFHHQKIQGLHNIMKETIDEFLRGFPVDQKVDVFPLTNRLAFDVVMNTLFDVELPPAVIEELGRAIGEIQEFVIADIRQPWKSWWFELSGQVARNKEKSKRTRAILGKVMQERKSAGIKYNDLLDMLLDARYEDTGEGMSENQVLDEILILFIAGHETTGNALAWTLYLLATHPTVLHKLRDVTRGLAISETVSHPYIIAVINESMRLYPPAWAFDRVSLEDDSFGEYSYPGGTIIALFIYGLHRDEKYWEDPLSFNPDRFISDHSKDIGKVFFPFGGGPRLCIGNSFAMNEMALFLQAFVSQFDLAAAGAPPKERALITLRPDHVFLEIKTIRQ